MKKLILNSIDTAQLAVNYINASNYVCSYALTINSTQLPALVIEPENYGNFVQTFSQGKLHVMKWVNEVIPDLNIVPKAFLSYNYIFQTQISTILTDLKNLKQTPNDNTIIQRIKSELRTLISEAKGSTKAIKSLDTAIADYQKNILPDANQISQLCYQITKAENVDAESIRKMNAVFDNLQSIIDDRNTIVTINTLLNIDEGIFLAVVGVAVGFVFIETAGLIIGIGFGIGCAVFTVLEPVARDIDYKDSIEDIQKSMDNINTEIGLINSTVGLLQNLDSQFKKIIDASSEATENIKIVLDFWTKLQEDTNQVICDLEDTLTNVSRQIIDEAINDLQQASKMWIEIEAYMKKLALLSYNISPIDMASTVTSLEY